MKSQIPHTVRCNITGEAAGEIWHWSLLGVKGLITISKPLTEPWAWECSVTGTVNPRGWRTWPWCSASSWRTTWPWGPSLRGWSVKRSASANRAASASAFPSTPRGRTPGTRVSLGPRTSAASKWYGTGRATTACPESRWTFWLPTSTRRIFTARTKKSWTTSAWGAPFVRWVCWPSCLRVSRRWRTSCHQVSTPGRCVSRLTLPTDPASWPGISDVTTRIQVGFSAVCSTIRPRLCAGVDAWRASGSLSFYHTILCSDPLSCDLMRSHALSSTFMRCHRHRIKFKISSQSNRAKSRFIVFCVRADECWWVELITVWLG